MLVRLDSMQDGSVKCNYLFTLGNLLFPLLTKFRKRGGLNFTKSLDWNFFAIIIPLVQKGSGIFVECVTLVN